MSQEEFLKNEYAVDEVKTCPSCSSAMVFSPETGGLKCPFCGYTPEAGEVVTAGEENDLMALLGKVELNEASEILTVRCPGCGAESKFEENIVAAFCPYCKSPIVASSRSSKTLRPQGVVPFAITKEQAASKFKSWVKGLWFAPGSLKNANLHESMKGVYRPMWTFDFMTMTLYTGERGEHYYETRTVRRNGKNETERVQKTRWTRVNGVVHNSFDDITVFASTKIDTNLQAKLGPWKIKEPQKYSEDIVRGFIEESYDVPLARGLETAKQKAESKIDASIRADIGGDEQRITTKETKYSHLTYKQLLVPFWSSKYHHGGKDYQFLVNGENGHADGERPYSGVKIFFFILGIIAVFGILLYFWANH